MRSIYAVTLAIALTAAVARAEDVSNITNALNATISNVTRTMQNATNATGNATGNMSNATGNASGGVNASMENQTNATTNATGTEAAGENNMNVTVDSVNEGTQEITATAQDQTKVSFSAANAKITDDAGQSKQLSDIKSGQIIELTYTGSKSSPSVSKIEIEK